MRRILFESNHILKYSFNSYIFHTQIRACVLGMSISTSEQSICYSWKEKIQSFIVFLFSASLLPYIVFIVGGKIDFLQNDLEFTDYHLSLIKTSTYITYINVACLFAIAIYTLQWSKKRPVLLISAAFFLLRIPWLLQLFSSLGISFQIISDVFMFGFILFLILYAYLKKIPSFLKKLGAFTLLSGFFNCSVGISSGIYFMIYPVDYSEWVRRFFIQVDIISWWIFGALLVINMFLVHIHVSLNSERIIKRKVDYKENLQKAMKAVRLETLSTETNVKHVIQSSVVVAKNSFVEEKVEDVSADIDDQFNYYDSEFEEIKKPVEIPRITRKDQIYWICEECGLSNPYFLPKCKECSNERPGILYDDHTPVIISKNKIIPKFSIVHVITDNWQTVEAIANKMGINDKKRIMMLRQKLTNLAKVNYLIPNSNGTMYKLNNFEL